MNPTGWKNKISKALNSFDYSRRLVSKSSLVI